MNKFLIPLSDYERITSVIYSILKSENANVAKSCSFFSIVGALILDKFYKVTAMPVAGVAAYKVFNDGPIIMFAENNGEELVCTSNGFHCWVEVEGWVFDFMTPFFNLLLGDSTSLHCPSKMMQKNVESASEDLDSLKNIGDFCVFEEPGLMNKLINDFQSKPALTDLAQLCIEWYKRPPKKIQKYMYIQDQNKNTNKVPFLKKSIIGAW